MNASAPPSEFAQLLPAGPPAARVGQVGVLIVNLGTPDATDYWSMRRYLKEFLSDRRVIETPRWLWWPILNLIILTRRPSVKGKDYDSIWNKERDEGPLKTITSSQARHLAERLTGVPTSRPIVVDWAMRYGKPTIASRLKALQEGGCDRILLVPLYPQYCAATSATVRGRSLFCESLAILITVGFFFAASMRSAFVRGRRSLLVLMVLSWVWVTWPGSDSPQPVQNCAESWLGLPQPSHPMPTAGASSSSGPSSAICRAVSDSSRNVARGRPSRVAALVHARPPTALLTKRIAVSGLAVGSTPARASTVPGMPVRSARTW